MLLLLSVYVFVAMLFEFWCVSFFSFLCGCVVFVSLYVVVALIRVSLGVAAFVAYVLCVLFFLDNLYVLVALLCCCVCSAFVCLYVFVAMLVSLWCLLLFVCRVLCLRVFSVC